MKNKGLLYSYIKYKLLINVNIYDGELIILKAYILDQKP